MSKEPQNNSGGTGAGAVDVFVSYAREDLSAARLLTEALSSRGLTCWLAEDDLRPGDDFGRRIREALDSSRLCLLVLSKASSTSRPWLSREWSTILETAWRRRTWIVLPVLLGGAEAPPFARSWHSIRLSEVSRDVAERAGDEVVASISRPERTKSARPSEADVQAAAQRFTEMISALRAHEIPDAEDAEGVSDE
ncbi:MAG: toll/interleukin-1 receptor domain-containing protein [Candidatus Eisenbacteria bacterium]